MITAFINRLKGVFTRSITWASFGFNQPTLAGLPVSPDVALTCSPVFAAVRMIAAGVATLPLCMYRKSETSGRERATDHPAYGLVHDQPNLEAVPFTFWHAFVASMLIHGHGVAEIEWNNAGEPIGLWFLPGDKCKAVRVDGTLKIRVTNGGQQLDLDSEDVLFVPYFSIDGTTGKGIVEFARETIGHAKGVEKIASSTIANAARPAGIVEYPGILSEGAQKNFRESLNEATSGPERAGRLLFLEQGAKLNPFGLTNKDAEILETRQFTVAEVARFFSISPTKLADLSRATWSNIESENRSFIEDTLLPILAPIVQELKRKLAPLEKDSYFEHVLEARLRGNTKERYDSYGVAIQNGFMTRDEAREMENRPKLKGLDIPLYPGNLVAVGQTPQITTPDVKPLEGKASA